MIGTLEKLYGVGLKLLVPSNPEETYTTIVEEAIKLVKAEYGSILLEKNDELVRVYASLPLLDKIKPRRRGILYQAFKNRQPIVFHPSKIKEIESIHPEMKESGARSIIVIPLSYRNQSIGILTVSSLKDEHFTTRELGILKLLGSLASLKIRNVQLYNETKKALESRDLFASMAAHELRTPITTINGYTQLLLSRIGQKNGSESRWISELSRETLRLTKLVSDLLEINYMRIGKLRYSLRECNIQEVVEKAVSSFKIAYPESQIEVESLSDNLKYKVIGDFDRLFQVVLNILDNAAKFSAPNSLIHISLVSKGQFIKISVSDHGRGIPKKDVNKIFEAFYKGDYDENKGMGLGLYLAKDIINHHHGEIHIHSKRNLGTTVEINLPKAKI